MRQSTRPKQEHEDKRSANIERDISKNNLYTNEERLRAIEIVGTTSSVNLLNWELPPGWTT
jgi:hypothetical protein